MTLKARESALPGIGYKVELETRSGDKLVIVTYDDGRRELYGFYPGNPDESIAIATLSDDEARQMAGILGGLGYQPGSLGEDDAGS